MDDVFGVLEDAARREGAKRGRDEARLDVAPPPAAPQQEINWDDVFRTRASAVPETSLASAVDVVLDEAKRRRQLEEAPSRARCRVRAPRRPRGPEPSGRRARAKLDEARRRRAAALSRRGR